MRQAREDRDGRAGGATAAAVDVEIDPQSCRFRRSHRLSNQPPLVFGLFALAKTEKISGMYQKK